MWLLHAGEATTGLLPTGLVEDIFSAVTGTEGTIAGHGSDGKGVDTPNEVVAQQVGAFAAGNAGVGGFINSPAKDDAFHSRYRIDRHLAGDDDDEIGVAEKFFINGGGDAVKGNAGFGTGGDTICIPWEIRFTVRTGRVGLEEVSMAGVGDRFRHCALLDVVGTEEVDDRKIVGIAHADILKADLFRSQDTVGILDNFRLFSICAGWTLRR